jgi:hypothetical protein
MSDDAGARRAFLLKHFGDRVICGRCGASFASMNRVCTAQPDELCQGRQIVGAALELFRNLH